MSENDRDGGDGRAKRERRLVRKERPVREGKERTWRFLRTLTGVLLVAWLLPALFAPLDPLTFFLWLAASWSVGAIVAIWLVYYDGYDVLAESDAYRPGLDSNRSLALFVGLTITVKVLSTGALDVLAGPRSYLVDAGFSAAALALAYAVVYGGVLAALAGDSDGPS